MAPEMAVRPRREEFSEMPGLRLAPAQTTRVPGVEREATRAVIDSLVAAGFLRWARAGAAIRAAGGAATRGAAS